MEEATKEINGVSYVRYAGDEFWQPVDYNSKHGIVCECGVQAFAIYYPEPYTTEAHCLSCGRKHTVHTG
jgi:hypothetical protein